MLNFSFPHHRANIHHGRIQLFVVMLLIASMTTFGASTTSAQDATSFQIVAPTAVRVGEPIRIKLVIRNASDIAGYETAIQFDPSAAHFTELLQRKNDLKRIGRDVQPLGPIVVPTGVVIGLFSCAADTCVSKRPLPRLNRIGKGTLTLGTVSITPDQAGILELSFANTTFVNSRGETIAVTMPTPRIAVRVGAAAASRRFPAPAATALPRSAPNSQPGAFDLTGDKIVTNADAMEVALGWTTTRENGAPCGASVEAHIDINHDGCVDVADLQQIAANYTTSTTAVPDATTNGLDAVAPAAALTFTVNSTADTVDANIGNGTCATSAGVCTLRAAIAEANAHAGPDTIRFAIPGSGVQTITVTQPLPFLNDATGGTTIDGYTQSGSARNTSAQTSNAVLRVQIQRSGVAGENGIVATSANNIIRGLAFFRVARPIFMYGSGAHDNIVAGNFIGTNAAGTFVAPDFISGGTGVVFSQGAFRNQIGSPNLADRNVVSGNYQNGISFYDETTDHNVIQNNIIGLNPAGTAALRNYSHGIDINGASSYNIIGGADTNERNLVSGNGCEGIELSHGTQLVENQVIGNFIGTDPTGTRTNSFSGNGCNGVHLEDGVTNNTVTENVIGNSGYTHSGSSQGGIFIQGLYTQGNVVANNRVGISLNGTSMPNKYFGILVSKQATNNIIGPGNIIANNPVGIRLIDDTTDFNTITRNAIYNNTNLGIDINPTGTTPNDSAGHTGPNQILNFPVLSSATPTRVAGTACANCTVEIFLADQNSTTYGEGRSFVGAAVADSSGRFNAAVSGLTVGNYVTATATDRTGNTSEFGRNIAVVATTTPTYVSDTFGRTVSNSWGSAPTGGAYSLSGTAADFDVNGSQGTINLPTAGAMRSVFLARSAQDTDTTIKVNLSKKLTGPSYSGQFVFLVARRINSTTEYRGKVRFAPDGRVMLQVSRVVSGAETNLSGEIASGATYAAGTTIRLRFQTVGKNPTTLRLRAWRDGSTEPTSWTYSRTDSNATLQASGSVGIRAYLASATTNAPILARFDDYKVMGVDTSGSTSPQPPQPPSTPYVQDRFSRTTSDGWGKAEIGGVYASSRVVSDFAVNGSAATVRMNAANDYRSAYLTNVSARDVDLRVRVRENVIANGSGTFVVLAGRRVSSGTEYRTRMRFMPNGRIGLALTKSNANKDTLLTSEVTTNVTFSANTYIWIRFQITGTNPTTLRAKVWRDGTTEPSAWNATVTNTDASLQAAGSVGVRASLSSTTTNGPVIVSYDDFRAAAP